MRLAPQALSNTFNRFFDSEKSSGILLIACTAISLMVANSPIGAEYVAFWELHLGSLSIEHWVNDGLMAVFFLLIGLELEREFRVGELSDPKNALLPAVAAVGGMIAPAVIHFALNAGTATQAGIGIPVATDIAFPLGVLAILGNRIPASLRVFVVAFAVIDDLGAIAIIAVFYTAKLSMAYLAGAVAVWLVLLAVNRVFRVASLVPYLVGGALLWVLMLMSGIHPTIAGVMLAFAIPFAARDEDATSASYRLEHALQKPVAFAILPLFALANTGIVVSGNWVHSMMSSNSLGIAAGLVLGKPLGVTLVSLGAVAAGVCSLPTDLNWRHIFGAGVLGGIGFTIAIFITNLAYSASPETANSSKMAILVASLTAGSLGYLWLRSLGEPEAQ
jgi:Na+:H+ antiporter, NhaA family